MAGVALSWGSAALGQLENVAQVAQIGQARAQHNEQIWWARRSYLLDSQSVRLDALDHAKEEIKSHYDTYVGRIDTLLLVLALIFPFALNVIQFSDPFVPNTAEDCPDCIESQHTWLVTLWAALIGIVLVLPFWGILMLIRCKLRLDKWLEYSLAGLHEKRRAVIRQSRRSLTAQQDVSSGEEDEHARKEEDDETELIVYKLVTMVLEYQEYMARQWNDELGWLVHKSTVLLWLSASSALLLTALSMWIFLINKGGAHTIASYWFFIIMTVGCAFPVLYMLWRRTKADVAAPVLPGVEGPEAPFTLAPAILASNHNFNSWEHWRPASPLRPPGAGLRRAVKGLITRIFGCKQRRAEAAPVEHLPGRATVSSPLLQGSVPNGRQE